MKDKVKMAAPEKAIAMSPTQREKKSVSGLTTFYVSMTPSMAHTFIFVSFPSLV